jgi:hypothetical protein
MLSGSMPADCSALMWTNISGPPDCRSRKDCANCCPRVPSICSPMRREKNIGRPAANGMMIVTGRLAPTFGPQFGILGRCCDHSGLSPSASNCRLHSIGGSRSHASLAFSHPGYRRCRATHIGDKNYRVNAGDGSPQCCSVTREHTVKFVSDCDHLLEVA